MTEKNQLHGQTTKTRFRSRLALGMATFILLSTGFLGVIINDVYAEAKVTPSGTPKNEALDNSKLEDKINNLENKISSNDRLIKLTDKLNELENKISSYDGMFSYVKTATPLLTIIIAIIASLTYYYTRSKYLEIKLDASDYTTTQVNEAKFELNTAKSEFEGLKTSVNDKINLVEEKFQSLEKNLTDKVQEVINQANKQRDDTKTEMDVRLTMMAISISFSTALIYWRFKELDTAIENATNVLNLIDKLPNNIEDNELSTKIQAYINAKPNFNIDLAYYRAERYRKEGNKEDSSYALGVANDMLKSKDIFSGNKPIATVDNYLFIILAVNKVDKPHKEKFIELFDDYKVELRNYLKVAGSVIKSDEMMNEYTSFYEEITKTLPSSI